MALDPRTPVIVGVAQTLRRPEDPAATTPPVDMMADALRLAADDSGAGADLVSRADSVRVAAVLSWRYSDPGALVAERLGISPRTTVVTTTGGNSPQMLLNDTRYEKRTRPAKPAQRNLNCQLKFRRQERFRSRRH